MGLIWLEKNLRCFTEHTINYTFSNKQPKINLTFLNNGLYVVVA